MKRLPVIAGSLFLFPPEFWMRLAVLALAASMLALTGCGEKETTGNTAAADQAVNAEDFATNDTTAIDAATGADANMAADVDINFGAANSDDSNGASAPRRPSTSRPRPSETGNSSNSSAPAAPASQPAAPPPETNAN